MKLRGATALSTACCSRHRDKDDTSIQQRICQLRWNWVLIVLSSCYVYGGWTITISTLYQYLTNPANTTCKDDHPGLGESEVVYSIAVAMYSAGEVVSSLSSASLSLSVGHSVLFFSGVILQTCAFLVYGLSNAGWMVIVARLLLGLHGGLILALPPVYFSMSVEEYNVLKEIQEGERRNALKKRLIFLWGFASNFTTIIIAVIVLVAAQFKELNQFLWIAWFQVACGLAIIVLMVLFFRDKVLVPSCPSCKSVQKNRNKRKASTSSTSPLEPSSTPHPIKPMVIFTIIYLILIGYVMDSYLSVLETLTNPILTDYFGMTSDTQVYFFLGTFCVTPIALIIMSILDRYSVSTRFILLGTFITSTIGLLLLGDWQTISPDPCNNFSLAEYSISGEHVASCSCSPFHLNGSSDCLDEEQFLTAIGLSETNSYLNVYSYADQPLMASGQQMATSVRVSQCPLCSNFTSGHCTGATIADGYLCASEDSSADDGTPYQSYSFTLPDYQSQLCLSVPETVDMSSFSPNCTSLPASLLSLTETFLQTDALEAQQRCESHSLSPDYCYWVQNSIITGQHCADCAPLCRSTKKIPHFAQVFIAISFFSLTASAGKFVLYILMVKVSPPKFLAIGTGLLVFMQGFARLTTPFWGNLVYVAVGRRTLIPVFIMILCQIPLYLGLCITWKTLRGTPLPVKTENHESLPETNAEGTEHSQSNEGAGDEKEEDVDVV